MEPLEQDQNVKTVTAFMDANGRHEVSVDLVALLVIMADLDRRNRALEQEMQSMGAELAELKKQPAESSAQVVNDQHRATTTKNEVDRYFETRANARSLFDLVP